MRLAFKLFAALLAVVTVFTVWSVLYGNIGLQEQDTIEIKKADQSGLSTDMSALPSESNKADEARPASDEKDELLITQQTENIKKDAALNRGQAVETKADPEKSASDVKAAEPVSAAENLIIPDSVSQKANSIARKDIELQDLTKAAGVILAKLSLNEIKYIFETASDDFWVITPAEEIEKIRSIIFSKLSDEDISVLRALGKKYGRSMTILEPNIDVAATKAKQTAKKQATK